MNKPSIFQILLFVTVLNPALALSQPAISIQHVVVNQPPPGVEMTAGYFDIRNAGNQPVSLVKVTSPDFGDIEMHKSTVTGGVARMIEQDSVTIAPNSNLSFEPGGYHLMMFRPKKQLLIGDTVFLTFYFSDSTLIQASAMVMKPGTHLDHPDHH